ncbi:VCBS repeat-containing protein [Parablautia intestinalis]|uniref:VCBS repeat-containing protein n=1 Tax=Parablautia intestinalis TaxID=2320100 RepID=UPI0024127A6F|nr:VCBS repeat-containing protein [Parablautia intestinalis]
MVTILKNALIKKIISKEKVSVLLSGGVCLLLLCCPFSASAKETDGGKTLLIKYQNYQQRFWEIERQEEIEQAGFGVIEDQIFPIETKSFGQVYLVPALDRVYNRLALFLADEDGNVVYKTDQLEANSRNTGEMKQPIKELKAISFQELNGDGLMDIVLITTCVNDKGSYAGKPYKVGDVLFQDEERFYRDYRISDKINRFGMNKSVESIVAFVRDGYSTEFLYTSATKKELLDNGFEIAAEQCHYRQFEKFGRLEVVPGTYTMANFATFMIYLVNEQGYIVWSFQPMGDFDNLYALKGITCRDIDGDGMKDIVVFARYSYEGNGNELLVESNYSIYYQRTGSFYEDTQIKKQYPCEEEDTLSGIVEKARSYWGWTA